MHSIFIINPKAGEGKDLQLIKSDIENYNLDAEIYYTKAPLDATNFVKKYLQNHENEKVRFIACGGDGTINEVFTAVVCYNNASVSVFPCGSGNDFVKVFGGRDKFLCPKKLCEAPEMKIDIMKVNDRYGFNVINFGFDTTVAETVQIDRERTGHGSIKSYTKGIFRALLKSMKNECTVKCDGEVLNESGSLLMCAVANGQYVGGSFKCAPRASLEDGLLEVCLCKPISRIRLLLIINIYKQGRHLDSDKFNDIMIYRQAKKIEVEASKGFAYSLDGEIIYCDKFCIEIMPKAINFAFPEI